MLNHQNYIHMIARAIDKNFHILDKAIEGCVKLKKARETYYQALNEYYQGTDNQKKNPKKYEDAIIKAEEQINLIKEDVGSKICDSYHTVEPLTIGLFGKWGSGKTHLLKGVKEEIIEQQIKDKTLWKDTKNSNAFRVEKLVIPIFFNAWRFEKEEHIIIPLFQTLLSELENYDYIPRVKKIKTKIKIISFALVKNLQMPKGLDIAKVFAGDFDSIKSLGGFFNWKGVTDDVKKTEQEKDNKFLLEQLLTSERIESVYLKIPQWIEKITISDDVRFVFLIDDLDRCLPENTLKMLESMKLFLDVAGCSFVLAVDDDVVERGVEHHYRDYLQRNSNHIYMSHDNIQDEQSQELKVMESNTKENHLVLPITGSEYLEKMVQLPFRIPSIDTEDVKEFLQTKYSKFKKVDQDLDEEKREVERVNEEIENLLNFFSTNIPSKPRKIIRTINLFESKEELMKAFNLEINPILLAKLTLLELFSPKLFRFMQTKGFVRLFRYLVKWKKVHKRLSETNLIMNDIKKEELSKIDKDTFIDLRSIIEEHYKSRVEFNLDIVFDERVDEDLLLTHIIFKVKKKEDKNKNIVYASSIDEKLFLDRILSNDELLWEDAFNEDTNLSITGVLLDKDSFKKLLDRLEQRKELVQNPIWLKNISVHLSDEDFKELLTRHNPFKGLKDE